MGMVCGGSLRRHTLLPCGSANCLWSCMTIQQPACLHTPLCAVIGCFLGGLCVLHSAADASWLELSGFHVVLMESSVTHFFASIHRLFNPLITNTFFFCLIGLFCLLVLFLYMLLFKTLNSCFLLLSLKIIWTTFLNFNLLNIYFLFLSDFN